MAVVSVIRPAEVSDAERIGLIHVRSWQSAYQGLISQDYLDGLDPAEPVPGRHPGGVLRHPGRRLRRIRPVP